MQKVIRRTQLAVAQAERRRLRKNALVLSEKATLTRYRNGQTFRYQQELLKKARIERREDWELGPLAPRRNVGNFKDTYGTVTGNQTEGIEINDAEKAKRLAPWGGKKGTLRKGDRVVVIFGREKGKIGMVLDINADKLEAKIEDINKIDVAVPEWMYQRIPEEERSSIQTIEKPVSLGDLRLVTALRNPETGEKRDIVVKTIELVNHRRRISGTEIIIPWPGEHYEGSRDSKGSERFEPAEDKRKSKIERQEKIDKERYTTLLEEVGRASFSPTLLEPPIPDGVIDELRNKYSKFRTRHTDEYVAQKMEEGWLLQEEKDRIKLMKTPLQKKNAVDRRKRRKMGRGILTPAMKDAIGKVIAKNKGIVVKPQENEVSPVQQEPETL